MRTKVVIDKRKKTLSTYQKNDAHVCCACSYGLQHRTILEMLCRTILPKQKSGCKCHKNLIAKVKVQFFETFCGCTFEKYFLWLHVFEIFFVIATF